MTDYGLAGLGSQTLDLYYFIEDENMKIYAAEDLPMFKELVERSYDWYQKGYLPVDVITARANRTYKVEEGNVASGYFLFEDDEKKTSTLQSKGVSGGLIKTYPNYDKVSFRAPASNNMYAVNANARILWKP